MNEVEKLYSLAGVEHDYDYFTLFDKNNGYNICCCDDIREDKIPFANFCQENKGCYYKQLKQAENTINECHKYQAKLEDKIDSLEQENNSLQAQLNNITVQSNNAITALEQENKELSFAIEKCLENAGIECDDEEQALRSLTDLGSSHYKLLLEKEERNFKINQLKANGLYNDLTGIEFSAKVVELEQENKQIKSALEEIKNDIMSKEVVCTECIKIAKRIDEVLNHEA